MLLLAVGLAVAAVLTDIGEPADTSSPPSTASPTPDVDDTRAGVDLADPPDVTSAESVARWWAATYTAYIAVESSDALADRLASVTTAEVDASLRSQPPSASYDEEPTAIEGVSQSPALEDAGGGVRIRVAVETPGALVVYDLVLVEAGSGAGWQVSGATRL